jgi:hypothetical protein
MLYFQCVKLQGFKGKKEGMGREGKRKKAAAFPETNLCIFRGSRLTRPLASSPTTSAPILASVIERAWGRGPQVTETERKKGKKGRPEIHKFPRRTDSTQL